MPVVMKVLDAERAHAFAVWLASKGLVPVDRTGDPEILVNANVIWEKEIGLMGVNWPAFSTLLPYPHFPPQPPMLPIFPEQFTCILLNSWGERFWESVIKEHNIIHH